MDEVDEDTVVAASTSVFFQVFICIWSYLHCSCQQVAIESGLTNLKSSHQQVVVKSGRKLLLLIVALVWVEKLALASIGACLHLISLSELICRLG